MDACIPESPGKIQRVDDNRDKDVVDDGDFDDNHDKDVID